MCVAQMVLLSKLLKKLFDKGHRVLIFTQMTKMLDIFEDFCVMRQYEYCRIDGNTSYENREDCIDSYNKVRRASIGVRGSAFRPKFP